MRRRKLLTLLTAGALTAGLSLSAGTGGVAAAAPTRARLTAASEPTLVVAAPECAHCLAMAVLGSQMTGYKVKFESFGTLTDLTAGLASGAIDIGQIDYTGLVSFISKGLPIVAISGEVNGGSDFVLSPKLHIPAGNWTAFEALVTKDKAAGHPLTIASQFGSVQDIELRLELPKYGINPNSDVDLVNVPYQGMAQALNNGSVEGAIPVQPFAAQITLGGYADHFAFPYDQAAGDLTNVVVVTKSFLASHPAEVAAVATGMKKLVPYLKTPAGKAAWAAAIEKYTSLGAKTVDTALTQLTPDIDMPFTQIQAIAKAMYTQQLISTPLSAATIKAHVDYQPLAQVTGDTEASFGAGA